MCVCVCQCELVVLVNWFELSISSGQVIGEKLSPARIRHHCCKAMMSQIKALSVSLKCGYFAVRN